MVNVLAGQLVLPVDSCLTSRLMEDVAFAIWPDYHDHILENVRTVMSRRMVVWFVSLQWYQTVLENVPGC